MDTLTETRPRARGGISRRRFAAATGALLTAGADAFAQQPAASVPKRVKGPRVWLDMDQKELDDAYDQSVYAPNQAQVTGRWASNSELARQRLGQPLRFAYGPTPAEGLDVFVTKLPKAPVNVFVHGGAWLGGAAARVAFPAELFVHAGAHFVVLDFINVTDSGGDLTPMADQVRRAVAWVAHNASKFGGDPGRIFLSGHSSGAHLAGVAMTTDWKNEFNLPADLLKGGLCCSGIFDLKPVRLSSRGKYVNFTDAVEAELSAQRHLDKLNVPLIVAHAGLDTPEFQRQSRDFAAAVKAAGKPVRFIAGEGYNHFEFIETLANPYSLLGSAVLQQMKLA